MSTNILLLHFIDEPENNLNPAIVNELWDYIESQKPRSIFVYLTHDSNFATSRINNKIYWIKEYKGNDEWDFKLLPENVNLPNDLIVELIGSQRPIIFCESENNLKLDAIIYKMMFPDFNIIAAGGSNSVITKTKAYKQLSLGQKAYGIIDRDYKREEYLQGNEAHNIYSLQFFEIENFLFSEKILRKVLEEKSVYSDKALEEVKKSIFCDFAADIEKLATNYTELEIREFLFSEKEDNLLSFKLLKESYQTFKEKLKIENIYNKHYKLLEETLNRRDLNGVLKYYDKKDVITVYTNLMDFKNRKLTYLEASLEVLRNNPKILEEYKSKYFSEIINDDYKA